MIPIAEIFAQKRLEAESLIRQHAPAPSHDELIALLQPAIALNATPAADTRIPLGASKFGGAPDVPDGFEWPTWNGKPLAFLAQINLVEAAPFDFDGQLPSAGVLLFWMELENEVWGEPDQRQGWRVLWARGPLHRVQPPADSDWIVAQAIQRVAFDGDWVLGNSISKDVEISDELDEFDRVPHRMLAPSYAPQLSPLVIAANGAQGRSDHALYDETVATDDWLLLLQLDTGAEGFFEDIYDVGWIYFMIRRDDLKSGDFSGVWFNGQCT